MSVTSTHSHIGYSMHVHNQQTSVGYWPLGLSQPSVSNSEDTNNLKKEELPFLEQHSNFHESGNKNTSNGGKKSNIFDHAQYSGRCQQKTIQEEVTKCNYFRNGEHLSDELRKAVDYCKCVREKEQTKEARSNLIMQQNQDGAQNHNKRHKPRYISGKSSLNEKGKAKHAKKSAYLPTTSALKKYEVAVKGNLHLQTCGLGVTQQEPQKHTHFAKPQTVASYPKCLRNLETRRPSLPMYSTKLIGFALADPQVTLVESRINALSKKQCMHRNNIKQERPGISKMQVQPIYSLPWPSHAATSARSLSYELENHCWCSEKRKNDNRDTNATSNHGSTNNSRATSRQSAQSCTEICRICLDGERNDVLLKPCLCAGTAANVHKTCLETWISVSGNNMCEVCDSPYKTEVISQIRIRGFGPPKRLVLIIVCVFIFIYFFDLISFLYR